MELLEGNEGIFDKSPKKFQDSSKIWEAASG
jgi:hypothetical protein